MNAEQTGREAGFTAKISYRKIVKGAFEKVGQRKSFALYRTEAKRAEFMAGWMENWRDPHADDCACKACADVRAIPTETY